MCYAPTGKGSKQTEIGLNNLVVPDRFACDGRTIGERIILQNTVYRSAQEPIVIYDKGDLQVFARNEFLYDRISFSATFL
jgi:hypothetical protein